MAGLDSDDLWSDELQGAAVSTLNMDLAMGQESGVRMHAEIRADEGFMSADQRTPVNDTFYAIGASSHGIDLDATNFAAFAAH